MRWNKKNLRRITYRWLPARWLIFYSARRRGLDHWFTKAGHCPVAQAQRSFLLQWVAPKQTVFLEMDAGDGIVGSHAVWLEEVGWKGVSLEERPAAAQLLKKNRPGSFLPQARSEWVHWEAADFVSARREVSIRRVVKKIGEGLRPRRVILQARDPQPDVFRAMNRAGYRLDHFIHDDEYYRLRDKRVGGC